MHGSQAENSIAPGSRSIIGWYNHQTETVCCAHCGFTRSIPRFSQRNPLDLLIFIERVIIEHGRRGHLHGHPNRANRSFASTRVWRPITFPAGNPNAFNFSAAVKAAMARSHFA